MAKRTELPQPRAPLSRDRVLDAAIAFADEHGVESLSMRRLAKELGVEAMSLYNHVANKNDILSGIVERVAGEVELPSDAGDWKEALRRSAISTKDLFMRHAWASKLWMSNQAGGPATLQRMDWMLRTMREAGLPKELVYHAIHIVDAYILGATVQHLSVPYSHEELADLAKSFMARMSLEDYPDVEEHIREHLEPVDAHKGGFELGLDLILEGLERLRDAADARGDDVAPRPVVER